MQVSPGSLNAFLLDLEQLGLLSRGQTQANSMLGQYDCQVPSNAAGSSGNPDDLAPQSIFELRTQPISRR